MSAGVTAFDTRRRTLSIVMSFAVGAIFGTGLLLSGMTDPAKVVGFLDVTRGWDPSLGFVMGGAVMVYALLFRVVKGKRKGPWFDTAFHLPTRRDIDLGLVAGAAIFGAGWGLGGLCPGPGLVAAASGSSTGLLFVGAMLVGMLAQHGASRR